MNEDQILTLAVTKPWLALVAVLALVAGAAVRILKSDSVPDWVKIPPHWRPVAAVVFAQVGSALAAVANGVQANQAILTGLIAGLFAVFGHEVVIEGARNGKELFSDPPKPQGPIAGAMLAMIVALVALPQVACATFWTGLTTAISYVMDASTILDTITNAIAGHVSDPATLKKFNQAMGLCRTALDLFLRLMQGGASINDANVQAAIASFEAAYADLLTLVKPLGVAEAGAPAAMPGTILTVPRPIVLGAAMGKKQ